MTNKLTIGKDILLGAAMAVLFVCAIFLGDLVSFLGMIPTAVFLVLIAALYGLCAAGAPPREILIRWLCSLPCSYLVLQYFWQTEFALRALNWMRPDYGSPSAGANFAGFFRLVIQTAFCAAALLIALCVGKKLPEKFAAVQQLICSVAAMAAFAVAWALEMQFPALRYG